MKMDVKNKVTLTDIPPEISMAIRHQFTISNPAYTEAEKKGRSTKGISRCLVAYEETQNGLIFPRGESIMSLDEYKSYPDEDGTFVNNTTELARVPFSFNTKLRPFQAEMARECTYLNTGQLVSTPWAGKIDMALKIIAARAQPTLIVVHTEGLMDEWVDSIEKILEIEAADVGRICEGEFRIGDQITVGMVQTVQERAPEISPYIGHLVMDECHDAPIMQYVKTVEQFNSHYLLGLTDTPYRRDGLERVLQWYLGPVAGQVNEQDILDNENLNPGRALLVPTGFTPVTDPSDHYDQALNEMTLDMNRNQFIAITILKYKCFGLTLILSEQEEQCESLGDIFNKKYCLRSAVLTAKTPAKQKRQIIKDLKAGKYHYLVATNKCIEKGLDLSRFSTLALVSPMKDSGSLIQYVCLALRQGSLKKEAFIIDFVDDHGEFASSSRSRWGEYERQGIQVSIGL